jgi:hypothetical protein
MHPVPPLITAWVYERHWIIQSYCNDVFDVIWDGQSINETNGYESSFAFQLMDGEPFYLFKRDSKVWVFYNNEVVLLSYDEVFLRYCCMTFPPPLHYENMITFYAKEGDQLYYVVIGKFE